MPEHPFVRLSQQWQLHPGSTHFPPSQPRAFQLVFLFEGTPAGTAPISLLGHGHSGSKREVQVLRRKLTFRLQDFLSKSGETISKMRFGSNSLSVPEFAAPMARSLSAILRSRPNAVELSSGQRCLVFRFMVPKTSKFRFQHLKRS